MYKLLQLHSLKVVTREKHDPALKHVACALMQIFSHASHQCGHNSLYPITVYTVVGGLQ